MKITLVGTFSLEEMKRITKHIEEQSNCLYSDFYHIDEVNLVDERISIKLGYETIDGKYTLTVVNVVK